MWKSDNTGNQYLVVKILRLKREEYNSNIIFTKL